MVEFPAAATASSPALPFSLPEEGNPARKGREPSVRRLRWIGAQSSVELASTAYVPNGIALAGSNSGGTQAVNPESFLGIWFAGTKKRRIPTDFCLLYARHD